MPTFDEDASRRIAQATRRLEKIPLSRARGPAPPRIAPGAKYAVVASTVGGSAFNGSTSFALGKGTGTLYTASYDPSDGASLRSTGLVVPIYSGAGDPIAAGRLVVVDFVDGRYHVVVDFCGG